MLCNARKTTQDTYREREGGLPRCFWIRAKQGGYVRATNRLYIIIIIIVIKWTTRVRVERLVYLCNVVFCAYTCTLLEMRCIAKSKCYLF